RQRLQHRLQSLHFLRLLRGGLSYRRRHPRARVRAGQLRYGHAGFSEGAAAGAMAAGRASHNRLTSAYLVVSAGHQRRVAARRRTISSGAWPNLPEKQKSTSPATTMLVWFASDRDGESHGTKRRLGMSGSVRATPGAETSLGAAR